ncbi:unnamed protein product, partial [Mesorhabditis belari]|uniref:Phospholipase B-like n=1 Tax=Mesorhabditis belari TaxID=2138241 RepID=A0AAF3E7X0_9BILA
MNLFLIFSIFFTQIHAFTWKNAEATNEWILTPEAMKTRQYGLCSKRNGELHAYKIRHHHHHTDDECEREIALAKTTNAINETGWAHLEVEVHDQALPLWLQGYAAGFVEGRATRKLIGMHIRNTVDGYCDGAEEYCKKLYTFLLENMLWMEHMIAQNPEDIYWKQVNVTLNQLNGIIDGYEGKLNGYRTTEELVAHPIFNIQLAGDGEDLALLFKRPEHLRSAWKGQHCSALVRLLPDHSDLYFSHVTWSSYSTMLRVLKKITWKMNSKVVPGNSYSFSSYPGAIPSTDDFMLSSSGLAILETTISNYNKKIMKDFIKPETVLCFIRAQIATRLSTGNAQWAEIFAKYNSGTYNNQWVIVDYKKFKPGLKKLPKQGLIHILEQLPGYIQHKDLSEYLIDQLYWPSYNMPYFPDVYNDSMTASFAEKYGDWFTYDKTPRALIFKRDYEKVEDMESMRRLMRSNDYTNDPLSRCDCDPPYSAENAISCRSELNPRTGTYPFDALGHRDHGATDMKLTNYRLHKKLRFQAISGPTSDSVPVFDWSTSDLSKTVPHEGQPTRWEFPPVTHRWTTFGLYKHELLKGFKP